MFKRLGNRGSLPLVMVIVMVIAMSIATLSSMLLTEKINMAYSITTDIERLYEKDSVNEVTKNVVQQVLLDKIWSEIDGEQIITSKDLRDIEEAVTLKILPDLGIDYAIQLEGVKYPRELAHYCKEEINADGSFRSFECTPEVFSVELNLNLINGGKSEEYLMVFENIRAVSDDMGNSVRLDTGSIQMYLK